MTDETYTNEKTDKLSSLTATVIYNQDSVMSCELCMTLTSLSLVQLRNTQFPQLHVIDMSLVFCKGAIKAGFHYYSGFVSSEAELSI